MRLSDWLINHKIRLAEFSRRVGYAHGTARRWLLRRGEPDRRIPDEDAMQAIHRVTEGAVTPNDFYEFTAPPPAAAPRKGSTGRPRTVLIAAARKGARTRARLAEARAGR